MPETEATWEAKTDLWQFEEALQNFEATRASANSVGENVTAQSFEA